MDIRHMVDCIADCVGAKCQISSAFFDDKPHIPDNDWQCTPNIDNKYER